MTILQIKLWVCFDLEDLALSTYGGISPDILCQFTNKSYNLVKSLFKTNPEVQSDHKIF